jgi:Ran GTPase-activating protein (RanGAP) involved in mRNA processing and transport
VQEKGLGVARVRAGDTPLEAMAENQHVNDAIASLLNGAAELNLASANVADAGAEALATVLAANTTLKKLSLSDNGIGLVGARALAAALDKNATLTELDLEEGNIGAEGARAVAEALGKNASLTSLNLSFSSIGTEGTRSLAAALEKNATLTKLNLYRNDIGVEGARSLAAALIKNATLTRLDLYESDIGGAQGERLLAAALNSNRTLQELSIEFTWDGGSEIEDLVDDRLRVNNIALKVSAWVVAAVTKVAEIPEHHRLPRGFVEAAAVLAFGDELLDLELPNDKYKWLPGNDHKWRTPGGRSYAAAYLLPLAEAALRTALRTDAAAGGRLQGLSAKT